MGPGLMSLAAGHLALRGGWQARPPKAFGDESPVGARHGGETSLNRDGGWFKLWLAELEPEYGSPSIPASAWLTPASLSSKPRRVGSSLPSRQPGPICVHREGLFLSSHPQSNAQSRDGGCCPATWPSLHPAPASTLP